MVEGSQRATGGIDIWLDDHPDQPEEYVFKQPQTLKRKREIQCLEDLRGAQVQVDPRAWSSGSIPVDMKELVKDMQAIGKGVGVIPLAFKEKFAATEEDIFDFQWAKEEGKAHGENEEKEAVEKITGGFGYALFWDKVSLMRRVTARCIVRNYPEPVWNMVHLRVLCLALGGYWEKKEIGYMDIAVAHRSNESLVPWTISIVGYGEGESDMQLGTWLITYYSRLRQRFPDKATTKLPSIPFLAAHGQSWLLMIGSLQDNDRIHLIKELYLGDTNSIAGIYQVIAAIRRVAQWVNDDYRPWFEKENRRIKAGVLTQPYWRTGQYY